MQLKSNLCQVLARNLRTGHERQLADLAHRINMDAEIRARCSPGSTRRSLPLAVLLINQTRTAHRRLAAFADIVLEMHFPRHQSPHDAAVQRARRPPTRRRIFTGVGRYPGTLQSITAELNADGTDYVLADNGTDAPPPTLLATLQSLLSASPEPLTQRDLLARWPGDPPRGDSVWRALSRGLEAGLFTASGAGTKNDPYRFAIARQPVSG